MSAATIAVLCKLSSRHEVALLRNMHDGLMRYTHHDGTTVRRMVWTRKCMLCHPDVFVHFDAMVVTISVHMRHALHVLTVLHLTIIRNWRSMMHSTGRPLLSSDTRGCCTEIPHWLVMHCWQRARWISTNILLTRSVPQQSQPHP